MRTLSSIHRASALALLAAFLLAACSKQEPAPQPVRAVRTMTVGVASAGGVREYAAEVRARTVSRLSFRVGGKLVRRQAALGDMVKLGQAMLDERLLTAKTRNLLVTVPDALPSGGAKVYALGWRRGEWTLHDGKTRLDSYHHAGVAVGATSVFVVFPEKRMVVSLMMNKGGQSADDLAALADKIIEAFIPAP